MKLEGYKAGIYTRVDNYKAFIISGINYNWSWEDPKVNKLLAEASRNLGELNAYSICLANIDKYIKVLIKIEAIKSCKIDEIDMDIVECLLNEVKEPTIENINCLDDIQNCIKAMEYGIENVNNINKLTTKLIGEMHYILMQGENEKDKSPGKLRNSQNWIGGDSVHNAIFVPPPHTEIIECLADFEKFIENDDTDTPDLVKLAILHYQFETIHPFLGGNGRIGRMIIPLYLKCKGMLDKANLCISNYLYKNKDTYFNKLTKVRENSDILEWIKFFTEIVLEASKNEKDKLKKLIEFEENNEKIIADMPVKAESIRKVLEVLYDIPVASRKKILDVSGLKPSTLNTIINSLVEKGIIDEITGQGRNQVFAFRKYLDILES